MTLDQLIAELQRRGFKRIPPEWYQRYLAAIDEKKP